MSSSYFRKTTLPKNARKRRADQVPRVFREVKSPIGVRREERRLELMGQLKNAREQVTYYRGKRLLATAPPERTRFGALLMAWEMTRDTLEAKLFAHNNEKEAA